MLRGYQPAVLVDKLVEFMTTVVRDESCRSRPHHGNSDATRLQDILCDFMYAYVPVPMGNQLIQHGALVNGRPRLGGGVNGNVFFSGEFASNPIVTKTPIKFSENYLTEMYINMVVINSLLMNGIQVGHLIPTYGLFVCPFQQGSHGQQICVPSRRGKVMDGRPNLLMVQQELKGSTLFDVIHTHEINLEHLEHILRQVFTTMLWLEFSPYELYHNDLHVSNIMVEEATGNAYIIDFGFAECTIDSIRTQNSSIKRLYCGDKKRASDLHTGAYDFFLLLHGLSKSPNLDVYEYIMPRLERFYEYFMTNYDEETETFSNTIPYAFWKNKKPWLYAILSEIESVLPPDERDAVHDYNMQLLDRMTNAQLCLWLFDDLDEWEPLVDSIMDTFG